MFKKGCSWVADDTHLCAWKQNYVPPSIVAEACTHKDEHAFTKEISDACKDLEGDACTANTNCVKNPPKCVVSASGFDAQTTSLDWKESSDKSLMIDFSQIFTTETEGCAMSNCKLFEGSEGKCETIFDSKYDRHSEIVGLEWFNNGLQLKAKTDYPRGWKAANFWFAKVFTGIGIETEDTAGIEPAQLKRAFYEGNILENAELGSIIEGKFQIEATGDFEIEMEGNYEFKVHTDGGFDLQIDGVSKLKHWDLNEKEKTQSIQLSKGWHSIKLKFASNGSSQLLIAQYSFVGNPEKKFLPVSQKLCAVCSDNRYEKHKSVEFRLEQKHVCGNDQPSQYTSASPLKLTVPFKSAEEFMILEYNVESMRSEIGLFVSTANPMCFFNECSQAQESSNLKMDELNIMIKQDVAAGWSETAEVVCKGEFHSMKAFVDVTQNAPPPINSINTNNGKCKCENFMNDSLLIDGTNTKTVFDCDILCSSLTEC